MVDMSNVLGIIFANSHETHIEQLTAKRTMGSVPFGARYRLIDFPLSNMTNSGISEVGVITKWNYKSLIDHIGAGTDWDLARKRGGLHLLPPYANNYMTAYRGKIDALDGALSFLKYTEKEYVLLCDCDIIVNIDFNKVLEYHKKTGADITAVCNKSEYTSSCTQNVVTMKSDYKGRVVEILRNPVLDGERNISLNMYVISKKLLIKLVQETRAKNLFCFERDILQAKINELKIYEYKFEGFFLRIDSIQNYYKANIMLIDKNNSNKLFLQKYPIYTKIHDDAPTCYGNGADVKNSIVADGCIIEGQIENCVIFRNVRIKKGCIIKNSIIMQNTVIQKNSIINNIITDKNVEVTEKSVLYGGINHPIYISKGEII